MNADYDKSSSTVALVNKKPKLKLKLKKKKIFDASNTKEMAVVRSYAIELKSRKMKNKEICIKRSKAVNRNDNEVARSHEVTESDKEAIRSDREVMVFTTQQAFDTKQLKFKNYLKKEIRNVNALKLSKNNSECTKEAMGSDKEYISKDVDTENNTKISSLSMILSKVEANSRKNAKEAMRSEEEKVELHNDNEAAPLKTRVLRRKEKNSTYSKDVMESDIELVKPLKMEEIGVSYDNEVMNQATEGENFAESENDFELKDGNKNVLLGESLLNNSDEKTLSKIGIMKNLKNVAINPIEAMGSDRNVFSKEIKFENHLEQALSHTKLLKKEAIGMQFAKESMGSNKSIAKNVQKAIGSDEKLFSEEFIIENNITQALTNTKLAKIEKSEVKFANESRRSDKIGILNKMNFENSNMLTSSKSGVIESEEFADVDDQKAMKNNKETFQNENVTKFNTKKSLEVGDVSSINNQSTITHEITTVQDVKNNMIHNNNKNIENDITDEAITYNNSNINNNNNNNNSDNKNKQDIECSKQQQQITYNNNNDDDDDVDDNIIAVDDNVASTKCIQRFNTTNYSQATAYVKKFRMNAKLLGHCDDDSTTTTPITMGTVEKLATITAHDVDNHDEVYESKVLSGTLITTTTTTTTATITEENKNNNSNVVVVHAAAAGKHKIQCTSNNHKIHQTTTTTTMTTTHEQQHHQHQHQHHSYRNGYASDLFSSQTSTTTERTYNNSIMSTAVSSRIKDIAPNVALVASESASVSASSSLFLSSIHKQHNIVDNQNDVAVSDVGDSPLLHPRLTTAATDDLHMAVDANVNDANIVADANTMKRDEQQPQQQQHAIDSVTRHRRHQHRLLLCELSSPRCQSRVSNSSGANDDITRCPSNGSHCSANGSSSGGVGVASGNDSCTPAPTPQSPQSPTHTNMVGGCLPLPATLAPAAAAAALLPPQTAAMAAYFNAAAAAAAQQNHLLLSNTSLATLVQQATQQQQQSAHSPDTITAEAATASPSPSLTDAGILDFSTKHRNNDYAGEDDDDDDDDDNHDNTEASDGGNNAAQRNGNGSDANDGADGDAGDNDENDDDQQMASSINQDPNSPLDLSVAAARKRRHTSDDDDADAVEDAPLPMRKLARFSDYKPPMPPAAPTAVGTWVPPPINPYLAAVAAASISPNTPLSPLDWNKHQQHQQHQHQQKILPNEATKALEKMTEMTRLGTATSSNSEDLPLRQVVAASTMATSITSSTSSNTNSSTGGRHSAWQSHWLNKGADAVKDVFKCVWCKQSFATLASLTVHMKETQHCGVNVPPSSASTTATTGSAILSSGYGNSNASHVVTSSHNHHHHQQHHHNQNSQPHHPHNRQHHPNSGNMGAGNRHDALSTSCASTSTSSSSSSSASSKSDLNLLIKETMPLPRKLVRGQDVWLGKGAEQTRQILKCMWCGQSFRSLAEMTAHMQETQHYTNIISQEQIISWKSNDEKGGPGAASAANSTAGTPGNISTGCITSPSRSVTTPTSVAPNLPAITSSSIIHNSNPVSSVFTCKVCDQAFSTLKELSNHMIKNSHYKDHMIRSSVSSGVGNDIGNSGVGCMPLPQTRRGRQTREKRKKSLPVRKLLELERAQQDYKNAIAGNCLDPALKPLRDFAVSTKITCEKCGDKIETALFVDHIRQCLDTNFLITPRRNQQKSPSSASVGPSYSTPTSLGHMERLTPNSNGRKTADDSISPITSRTADILCPLPPKDTEKSTSSTPSVLNAIEQLIEKSFDTRSRHNSSSSFGGSQGGGSGGGGTPLGSSILKRLGIDDNVDYTKPLMDPQTMNFLRSYSHYSTVGAASGRDRSASESSTISERSRLDSITPERTSRQPTPRLTPEKVAVPATAAAIEMAMNLRKEATTAALQLTQQPAELEPLKIKSEPIEMGTAAVDEMPLPPTTTSMMTAVSSQKISVKKEFSMTAEDSIETVNNKLLPAPLTPSRPISPSLSERSVTPKSTTSSLGGDKTIAPPSNMVGAGGGSSLNALSSMFDNLTNMKSGGSSLSSSAVAMNLVSEPNNNNINGCGGGSGSGTEKKSKANPLAALQKLCDTTDPPAANTRGNSVTTSVANSITPTSYGGVSTNGGGVGNMLAFSWACNDAVMAAAADSTIIKCSFCDTPFCSKGAYRHHLSKVHFIKETVGGGGDADGLMKSPGAGAGSSGGFVGHMTPSPKSSSHVSASPKSCSTNSKSPIASPAAPTVGSGTASSSAISSSAGIINPYSESSQSKFLKYTELAKQLSSKNV